ncbi:MAG: ATP-binding cassette domain-containing protein [Polyangiales bacterium]
MIRLEQVSKVYTAAGGRTFHALSEVSLTVERGQVYGVIGSSGAGKSTLLRCINLLERPSRGRVVVDGVTLTDLPERALADARRNIGMISQTPNLLASRTIAGNVALALELAGAPAASIRPRVDELLTLVGILDKRDARPAQLSGGQRQRATIARALANQPSVLLCDEATSALDPATTRSILALLRDINRRLAITILLITHEMEVVKRVCDRVAILSDGKLVEEGSVDAVFARASSQLARTFLEATHHLDLPDDYGERLLPAPAPGTHPVLRIALRGQPEAARLISTLARSCEVHVDLLGARADRAAGVSFGALLVELSGSPDRIDAALALLRARAVDVEVLGHVAADG